MRNAKPPMHPLATVEAFGFVHPSESACFLERLSKTALIDIVLELAERQGLTHLDALHVAVCETLKRRGDAVPAAAAKRDARRLRELAENRSRNI